jgi:REP element-mobilizing transposase RayT
MRPNQGVINHAPTGSIGEIVRAFKARVSHQIGFRVWQRNYHEHITHNDDEYNRVAGYIANNPENWTDDKLYTKER